MRTGSLPLAHATRARSAHIVLGRIALLLGLAVSQVGAEPATSGIGVITAVQGQVTVVHPLAKSPVPAKVDTDVMFRDIIETQNESRTKALFDDETLLTVGEHSRVEITEHIYDPSENRRSMVVKLVRGKLRALVSKVFDGSGSKFEVHTPTAVAAARGTYFVVWVQGELSGVVNIGTSGRVDFTSGGQTVSLAPGQFSVAPSGVLPTLPAVFGSGGSSLPPGQGSTSPGLSNNAPGRSGTTPGQGGLTPSQGAPPPGQVGATPGQSGTAPGKAKTTPGQAGQAGGTLTVGQDARFLASVKKAIEGTDLRDTPRPEKAGAAVLANGGSGRGDGRSQGRDLKGGQAPAGGRKKDSSSGSIGSSSRSSEGSSQGIGVGVTGGIPPGQGGTPPGQAATPPAVISGASRGGGNSLSQGIGIGVTGGTPPGLGGTPPGLGGTPPGQGKK